MENESILERYGENLTAVKYLVNPAVARDKELKEMVMVLLTPEKSAVLVGKPGIGKTAIVEGLAYRLQLGDIPNALKGYSVWKISAPALVGNHDGENKVMALVEELKKHYPTLEFDGINYNSSSLHIYKGDMDAARKVVGL